MAEENTLAIQLEKVFGIKEDWNVLNFFIDKSKNAIKNYCVISEVPEDLNGAVIELAHHFYRNRHNTGVVQQSQGSRSATYKDGIPQSIKDVLPLPKVRLMG